MHGTNVPDYKKKQEKRKKKPLASRVCLIHEYW